jgi:hypothetical protein
MAKLNIIIRINMSNNDTLYVIRTKNLQKPNYNLCISYQAIFHL